MITTDKRAEEAIVGSSGSRALVVIDFLAESVLVIAIVGELSAVFANVIFRTLLDMPLLWVDEIAQLALSTMTFVGGAAAYRRRHHTSVRVVLNFLPKELHNGCLAVADLFVVLTAVVTGIASASLLQMSWSQFTPILQMPVAFIVFPLTLSMGLLALYAIEHLWREHDRLALVIAGPFVLLLTAGMLTRDLWLPWFTGDNAILASLGLFLVTIFAGLPVGFALLLAAAAYIWTSDIVPMVSLPQNVVNGTSNFVLLALPFFIVAGFIMERGGISLRLVSFVHALVGHLRGGLFQVIVVSMYLVSGLSGSKAADVAAVGTVMRDMLKRERYDVNEATAVLAASAAMGETVPPSIAMLILGAVTKLSMAALFIAGIIPAGVIALCLMGIIYARAYYSEQQRSPRVSFAQLVWSGAEAVLPLLMPVMLLAGILFGVATPTEVSSFAVVYGVVLATLIYREMTFRQFLRTIIDSALLTGMVLFILAAASAFSWVLTVAYVPQRLVELLHNVHESTAIFLIGSIVLLIVVGSLLEGLPALNVLAPMLVPLAGQIGISELHYGIVLIIAMGVGAFLPPAGVGFYVCCAIMRTDIERASVAMVPYLLFLVIGLLIVTFVPWFTLVLPHAFGYRG